MILEQLRVAGQELSMRNSLKVSITYHIYNLEIAMCLYKRDWKKVEAHIGTRSGAQIRSHAQKYFTRIEREMPDGDIEAYINAKAQALRDRKTMGGEPDNHDDFEDEESKEPSKLEEVKASSQSLRK